MSAQIAALQQLLEQRFPDAVPVRQRTAGGIATGIEPLDRALPGGGLPRGRIAVWAPGGGATATLRAACSVVTSTGERAVWIDALGTTIGDFWDPRTPIAQPRGSHQAQGCAEELVRCGGFALVVLNGGELDDAARVRLSRAVREGGSALAILNEGGFMAGVRVRSRIAPDDYRWRVNPFGEPTRVESVTIRAHVTALGWDKEAIFSLPVAEHDLRLSLEPALGDRRGAAR